MKVLGQFNYNKILICSTSAIVTKPLRLKKPRFFLSSKDITTPSVTSGNNSHMKVVSSNKPLYYTSWDRICKAWSHVRMKKPIKVWPMDLNICNPFQTPYPYDTIEHQKARPISRFTPHFQPRKKFITDIEEPRKHKRSTTETIQGTTLPLERIHYIQRGNSLAFGVFSVGDRITNNTLKECL